MLFTSLGRSVLGKAVHSVLSAGSQDPGHSITLWLECDLTYRHLANVGIFIIPRDTIKEASILGYFRAIVVTFWLRITPFRNIQMLSNVQFPSLFLKPICHALVFPVPRF